MTTTKRLRELEKIISSLTAQNNPPTFERFRAMWADADELSRSLIAFEASTPGVSDQDTRERIAGYLAAMGVEIGPETTLAALVEGLQSDD